MSIQNCPCPLAADYAFDSDNSDEFDGNQLNLEKWWDYTPEWRGRKEFLYRHENVSVADGCLLLTAKAIEPSEVSYEDRVDGIRPYTMPIVKSRQQVLYGYFECCSRGTAAEVRNAFWLYDPLSGKNLSRKYKPGSHSEEIDIYEFIGKMQKPKTKSYIGAHVHRFETPYLEGVINSQKTDLPNPGGAYYADWIPSDDFHTYGLLWTRQEIIWFIDGLEYFRRINDYFHTPLHIVFDCELANWGGADISKLDHSTLPAVHSVQYFRRWMEKV